MRKFTEDSFTPATMCASLISITNGPNFVFNISMSSFNLTNLNWENILLVGFTSSLSLLITIFISLREIFEIYFTIFLLLTNEKAAPFFEIREEMTTSESKKIDRLFFIDFPELESVLFRWGKDC